MQQVKDVLYLLNLKSDLTLRNPLALYKWLREEFLESVYPNVEILLRMLLSTPITNASAYRYHFLA